MTLDTRIRAAVDETVRTPLDVDGHLADLRRTWRNRFVAKAGAALGAVALVAAGLTLHGHPSRTPEPTPSPRSSGGALVSLEPDGALVQLAGPTLAHLPDRVLPDGPFGFVDDGRALIYAAGTVVRQMDVKTGETSGLALCPTSSCDEVGVSPDLTRYAVAQDDRVVVHVIGSVRTTTYPVGAPVSRVAPAPGGFAVAYTTRRKGAETLELVGRGPGDITTLVRLQAGDYIASGPTWSPDGHQLAFVVHQGPAGDSAHLALETVTTVGHPLVSPVRVLDICTCRGFTGGLAWSPDGSRIAVAGVSRAATGNGIWSTLRDGSGWRREAAPATGRVAWQPVSD
jgi:hypothetical protein